jgi:transcriptional regulator with XRE-family HTH domain
VSTDQANQRPDLYRLLGAGIRAARQRLGLSQEQAAAKLRGWGLLTWRRGTVAQVEAGSRRPSLAELLLVASALETTLARLIPEEESPAEYVKVAEVSALAVAEIRGLLADDSMQGLEYPPQVPLFDNAGEWVRRTQAVLMRALRVGEQLGLTTGGQVRKALAGLEGEAEQHAAKKLGTDPATVCVAAEALWGRTLTAERDRRVLREVPDAGVRELQARRGHVTRGLVEEIAQLLKDKGVQTVTSETD